LCTRNVRIEEFERASTGQRRGGQRRRDDGLQDQARLLLTKLNEHSGEAASPIVDGVRHKILETGADRGYAVTYVPESVSGPHMAKLGEDRYYKRSGDRFYRMEHFDLEDMFGRRQKPDLHLVAEPMAGLGDERERVAFKIGNKGRALAKHTGFFAKFENATIVNVSGGNLSDVSGLNEGQPRVSFDHGQSVIHPLDGALMHLGWAAFTRPEKHLPVLVNVRWYCENMAAREETFQLPPAAPGQPEGG
jgi:hypothetical protein